MIVKIVLSRSGMGIEEGTVATWFKAEGDRVTAGEIVVEIETAKAAQEIEAPATGVLKRILLQVGETAPVDTEIGEIEVDGD